MIVLCFFLCRGVAAQASDWLYTRVISSSLPVEDVSQIYSVLARSRTPYCKRLPAGELQFHGIKPNNLWGLAKDDAELKILREEIQTGVYVRLGFSWRLH